MSSRFSRQQGESRRVGAAQRRNIYLAAELPLESIDEEGWEERVAREVRHQELIEASFDRAEAHARLGDFEHALDWLDRVVVLSGELPAGYAAQRARWARAAASRLQPAAGDWKHRPVRSGHSWACR